MTYKLNVVCKDEMFVVVVACKKQSLGKHIFTPIHTHLKLTLMHVFMEKHVQIKSIEFL